MILDKINFKSRHFVFDLMKIVSSSVVSVVRRESWSSTQTSLEEGTLGGRPVLSGECITCKICVEQCPTQALAIYGEEGKAPELFTLNTLLCIGCTDCVAVCPVEALSSIPQTAVLLPIDGPEPLTVSLS
jgi:formate hydrogenlyase subunit 6/NADH:ubiquinone oxidoreductase subunit I